MSDEEDDVLTSAEDKEPATGDEPQYAFEGFDIEFSDKVMLMPLTNQKPAKQR